MIPRLRFYPQLTEPEALQVMRALESEGASDDPGVIQQNLRGLDEYLRRTGGDDAGK